MKLVCLPAFTLLSLAMLPQAAHAQAGPRSIDDCERYSEPLAYNACLAKFGPERGSGHMVTSETSADGDEPGETADQGSDRATTAAAAAPSRRHGRYKRSRSGRYSASFDVSDYVSSHKPSRKRHYRRHRRR